MSLSRVLSKLPKSSVRNVTSRGFSSDPEMDTFLKDVQKVEEWWKSPRWQDKVRNYSAEEVVRLRGTLPTMEESPANLVAKKAYAMFRDLQKKGETSATFGCLDPVQLVQMSKYLSSIYVSGWQSSSTCSTSNEPGPDVADYPMDTCPNKVDQLFRAQLFHDRKQRHHRLSQTSEWRKSNPSIDYMIPIISDADTGHGGLTAVMKLVKMFVESGVTGMHLEDQKPGTKKCGHMGGKVLVSTQEHIDRLTAARLQCDIMGVDSLIVARTDAEAANLIDSNFDKRDQPFILGTTNERLAPMISLLEKEIPSGEAKFEQKEWLEDAKLTTYFEAVETALKKSTQPNNGEKLQIWQSKAKYLGNSDAKALATDLGQGQVNWSWEKPRTREGYYLLDPCIEACIQRQRAFAPYADLLWMETAKPVIADAKYFAQSVKEVHPNQMLAYNLSPSFNWDKAGMNDEQLGTFVKELGQLGYVWQFITLAGFHANALIIDKFAKDFAKRGMRAYVETIQREERIHGVETLTHQKWSGAELIDAQLSTVSSGTSSTLAMGQGVTEAQFRSSLDDPNYKPKMVKPDDM